MKDKDKTKDQLVKELIIMRARIAELEKKETEHAFIKDRAHQYLKIAKVILLVIESDQKISLINKKGCEILGYKEEEIIGKNWFDHFIPERIRADVKQVFNNLIEGNIKPPSYFENPVLTKGGKERFIAWHNTILKDEQGNITGSLSSGEDITARREVENKLKERMYELEKFYDMAINREIKMKEIKEEIVRLKSELSEYKQ